MPEIDDTIEEVVDGEIILMPAAKALPTLIVANLDDALRRYLHRPQHLILTGVFGPVISERPLPCRNPDLAVYEMALCRRKDGYFRSAPQVIVEVLSPSETRQMTERKLQDYEAIGAPEVWVISPKDRVIELFHLQGATLERAAVVTTGILKPRAFPQVEIDVATIWPE